MTKDEEGLRTHFEALLKNVPLGMHPNGEATSRLRPVLMHGRTTAAAVFTGNKFTAILTVDAGFLHASISHTKRYPSWEEIKAIRYWFFPNDMEVVMVLPAEGHYINLSPNCFHLWESTCQREGR